MLSRVFYIIVFCFVLTMSLGCERDFDELNDTNQRYVEFSFNTDYLFSDILHYDGESYYLDKVEELPEGHIIRITSYCYDECDSLVSKYVQLSDINRYSNVKFRNLDKNTKYRFVFIADVVELDAYVDFYEVWYQMSSRLYKDFYIYSDYRYDGFVENIIGSNETMLYPANQTCNIDFAPLTYNGYCIFKNMSGISKFTCIFYDTYSFKFDKMESIGKSSLAYRFEFENEQSNYFQIPLTFCSVDDEMKIKLISSALKQDSQQEIMFENKGYSPFVLEIDCITLELDKITYLK